MLVITAAYVMFVTTALLIMAVLFDLNKSSTATIIIGSMVLINWTSGITLAVGVLNGWS